MPRKNPDVDSFYKDDNAKDLRHQAARQRERSPRTVDEIKGIPEFDKNAKK